ncbi:SAVED domain-containing protein [Jatrophihabitans sp. YIM 134969]
MTGPLPSPSATGVRVGGDYYQWLWVWCACLDVLRDNTGITRAANPAVTVGVEDPDAGTFDDVVIYRQSPPHEYTQVKYTVDGSSPVSTAYLTESATLGGRNLLRKFAETWATLSADNGPGPLLRLVTNRNVDPGNPLLSGIDARTELLLPNAAAQGPASARGRERAAWAAAAGVPEADLLRMLGHLQFKTGRGITDVADNLRARMTAQGLRSDDAALLTATAWVAQHVRHGHRRIDADTIRAAIDTLELHAGDAWATLSISTIKPDPLSDQAVASVDWVDRFDGDDEYAKRHPKAPATWQQLNDDIASAARQIVALPRVMITGSFRLSTGFTVGAALRGVTGVEIARMQGPQLWRSDAVPTHAAVTTAVAELGGSDLAIVVDVATRATDDVVEWLQANRVSVGKVISVAPAARAHDRSISSGGDAVAVATAIRDVARQHSKGASRVHLFLAAPLGLALLLGHRWNRIKPTVVYEDLGNDAGYELAYTVSA